MILLISSNMLLSSVIRNGVVLYLSLLFISVGVLFYSVVIVWNCEKLRAFIFSFKCNDGTSLQ